MNLIRKFSPLGMALLFVSVSPSRAADRTPDDFVSATQTVLSRVELRIQELVGVEPGSLEQLSHFDGNTVLLWNRIRKNPEAVKLTMQALVLATYQESFSDEKQFKRSLGEYEQIRFRDRLFREYAVALHDHGIFHRGKDELDLLVEASHDVPRMIESEIGRLESKRFIEGLNILLTLKYGRFSPTGIQVGQINALPGYAEARDPRAQAELNARIDQAKKDFKRMKSDLWAVKRQSAIEWITDRLDGALLSSSDPTIPSLHSSRVAR
jgi:hypothetical protein